MKKEIKIPINYTTNENNKKVLDYDIMKFTFKQEINKLYQSKEFIMPITTIEIDE